MIHWQQGCVSKCKESCAAWPACEPAINQGALHCLPVPISFAEAPECGWLSLLYPPRPRCQSCWWVSLKQDLIWDAFWAAGQSFSWSWRYVMICVPWVPDLQRMLVCHLCLLLQLKQFERLTLYILETCTVVLRGRQNGHCRYLHIPFYTWPFKHS